ncbi:hypothetical protein BDZ91DRAFT_725268 [Kalaharituber pfeilii]|nr:hypothetical protein BDZ91DRAFT_725268 [Kalaharituber pfeilii]
MWRHRLYVRSCVPMWMCVCAAWRCCGDGIFVTYLQLIFLKFKHLKSSILFYEPYLRVFSYPLFSHFAYYIFLTSFRLCSGPR